MEYNYNKKSIWKWIVLCILIGIVAYGLIYYFFFYKNGSYNYNSQTKNNEIASWETYENSKYGFEIKYPKDWVITNRKNNKSIYFNPDETIIYLQSPKTLELLVTERKRDVNSIYAYDLVISFWPSIKEYSHEEKYYSLKEFLDDKNNIIVRKIKEIIINNQKFYQIESYGMMTNIAFLADYKGIYELNFGTSAYKPVDKIGEQILSTFKFTK